MKESGLSLVILSNPANYNYIAGYDAMSYQNTQCLVVPASNEEPVWICRGLRTPVADVWAQIKHYD